MPTIDVLRGALSHNTRIAAALLEVLADSGDVARRARALRAIGAEGGGLRRRDGWIPTRELALMLRAAALDRVLARRVGQRLVRPDGVGLALCYGGLATPEKAYRRSHQLLARECKSGRYEPREIDGQSGRILYHPPARGNKERLDDELGRALCGLRQGMLEAVPMLFGLVPARVREIECAFHGSERCVFELAWTRQLRTGLWLGAGAGALLGASLGLGMAAQGLPTWAAIVCGAGMALLTAAAGRGIDLARQLEAVAGARRGQLALLDQLDASLAERMDELAKAGATGDLLLGAAPPAPRPDPEDGLVPVERRRTPAAAGEGGAATPSQAAARSAASELREAVAALRSGLGSLQTRLGAADAEPADSAQLLRDCSAHGRRIEALATELDGRLRSDGAPHAPANLAGIAQRTIDELRAQLPRALRIEPALASDLPPVLCDAFQLGFVLEQLLRSAAEATGEQGCVHVELGASPSGVELAVRSEGSGLDPEAVEQAFDPFFSAGPSSGADAAFGLQVCYRIVEEHGGELHVQSAEGSGTRVSLLLPAAPADD